MVQRFAVGAAFGSAGGFYSQYKANKPCLQYLMELDQHENAPPSPLAVKARQVLQDGGPMSIRRMQTEQAERRAASTQSNIPQVAARLQRMHSERATASSSQDTDDAPAVVTAAPPQVVTANSLASDDSTTRGDSWEAVRQRYQARAAGDDPAAASAAREAYTQSQPGDDGLGGRRGSGGRVVKNAYGDEVVVE